ncbi:MAG: T9SS type A sorting domain-containing protein [Salibacteraceae bacterium]
MPAANHGTIVGPIWSNQIPYQTCPPVACGVSANYSVSATTICAGDSVLVVDESQQAAVAEWFVDGVSMGTSDSLWLPFITDGTYEIALVAFETGCTDTATQNLSVNALPNVQFAPLPAVCEDQVIIGLSGATPSGGQFSGTNVFASLFVVPTPGSYPITYTYIDSNGCVDSAMAIQVVNAPPTVSLTSQGAICSNQDSLVLSGGTPLGGSFSGPGVVGNTLVTNVVGTGPTPVYYAYTDSNGCTASDTASLQVNLAPLVFHLGLPDACEGQFPIVLNNGFPSGGAYSGLGVSGPFFDPQVTGIGTFTITYVFTDTNGCSGQDSIQVMVHPNPTVTLTAPSDFCIDASPMPIPVSPIGGNFSGNGYFNGSFYPGLAGVGTHPLVYSFIDSNGCSASDSAQVMVNAMPVVSHTTLPSVCIQGAPLLLTGGMTLVGSYQGTGVNGVSFDPSVAGAGTASLSYSYVDSNGCSDSIPLTIQVQNAPIVSFLPLDDLCDNGVIESFSSRALPTGGVFSGNGIVDPSGIFDPSAATTGVQNITYTFTDSLGCSSSANQSFDLWPLPLVDIGNDTNICAGEVLTLDAGSGSQLYLWSTNETSSSINVDQAGNYSVFVTDFNGCENRDSMVVGIYPLPLLDLGPDTTSISGAPVAFNVPGFVQYNWSDGSNMAQTSVAITTNLNLMVTDANGCQASDTVYVEIWPTGISTNASAALVKVFPNPSDGHFVVELTGWAGASLPEFRVWNAKGQLVKTGRVTYEQTPVDLSNEAPGQYWLQLSNGEQHWSTVLIRH